jgi:hypothetical protein
VQIQSYDVNDLNTGTNNNTNPFRPSDESMWETDTLSIHTSTHQFQIKFETSNGGGNNIYLGNIHMNNGIVGIESLEASQVKIYPNPSQGRFTVAYPGNFNFKVFDVSGRLVTQQLNVDNSIQVNLRAGVYLIEVEQGNSKVNQKIIIQ